MPPASPAAAGPPQLPRVLGAWQLTLLGVGAIVGTGIFVLGGQVAARHTGPAVTLAFLFAGLSAMLAALCYCELAAMAQGSGTAYAFATQAFGRRVGFCVGWTLLLVYTLAAASVAVGWSAYVRALLRRLWPPGAAPALLHPGAAVGVDWLAMAVVVLLCALLAGGVQQAARFNSAMVAVKLLVILAFLLVAGPQVQPPLWVPYLPANAGGFGRFGASGLLQGTSLLFFAYNGFDAISAAAQEARRPQRDLPLAILAAVSLASLLYMATAAVLTGVVPYLQLDVPHPLSLGLQAPASRFLQPWLELGAVAGLTSVMLVNLYSQPRVALAMAADGLLPARLARLQPGTGTPRTATWLGGVLSALSAAWLPLDVLAPLMCAGTLAAFAVVSLAVPVLRRRQPQAPRPFRVPGPPWGIPLAAALICLLLLAVAQPRTLLHLLLWLAVGVAGQRWVKS